jgi:hypothetical protein
VVITQADLPEIPGIVQEIYIELSKLTGVPVSRGKSPMPIHLFHVGQTMVFHRLFFMEKIQPHSSLFVWLVTSAEKWLW